MAVVDARRRVGKRVFLAMALTVMAFVAGGLSVAAQDDAVLAATVPSDDVAQVYFGQSTIVGVAGGTHDVTVHVGPVEELGGFYYVIYFDPEIAEVVDSVSYRSGVQIAPSSIFSERAHDSISNMVDNETGKIVYGEMIKGIDEYPVAGPGELGTITFRFKQTGSTALQFGTGSEATLTRLSRTNPVSTGTAIPASWQDGQLIVSDNALYLPLGAKTASFD